MAAPAAQKGPNVDVIIMNWTTLTSASALNLFMRKSFKLMYVEANLRLAARPQCQSQELTSPGPVQPSPENLRLRAN